DLEAKIAAEGRLPEPGKTWPVGGYNAVSTGYFETLGIPLLRGRDFSPADDRSARRVAIVNETLAARLWPGQEAPGKRLILGPGGPVLEVVGVARDGKYGFLFEPPLPFFYVPLAQESKSLRVLHLATAVDPTSLTGEVRRLIRGLDPTLPAFNIQTLDGMIHDDVNGFLLPRVAAVLAGILGLLGLFLSLIGIY